MKNIITQHENISIISQNYKHVLENTNNSSISNDLINNTSQNICENINTIENEINKIKLIVDVTTESISNTLQKNNIHLEQTKQATERSKNLLIRAENFFKSIENPGRIALYTVSGLTLAFTLYNIFRYGQLPFSSLISKTTPIPVENITKTATNINFNYPQPLTSSTNIQNDLTQIINSPWLTITVGVTIILLTYLRK